MSDMLVQFEHFAVSQMMGHGDTPPRTNGTLCFANDWQRSAFGMALGLAKAGHFEWEDFRIELMTAIKEWEASHALDDPSWNYYEQWLIALERTLVKKGIAEGGDILAGGAA